MGIFQVYFVQFSQWVEGTIRSVTQEYRNRTNKKSLEGNILSLWPGGGTKAKMGTGTCRWAGYLFQPLGISDRGSK